MKQLKILRFFNGMANGMTEIEQGALPLFQRVFFYHQLLYRTAPQKHFLQNGHISVADLIHVFNKPFIKKGIFYQTVLHYFAKAGKILSAIQRLQSGKVHIYQPGHLEGAYHVLVAVKVHPRLSPDAAVALR